VIFHLSMSAEGKDTSEPFPRRWRVWARLFDERTPL
jgi:hypothetical protein